MTPQEHRSRDASLPWPPDGGLDRAYRARIRERLAKGRTLLQAELEAFAAVAPAIAPEHRPLLSEAFAPPGPDELQETESRS